MKEVARFPCSRCPNVQFSRGTGIDRAYDIHVPEKKNQNYARVNLSPVSQQISDCRKFPTMSALSSKHTLSSCSLAVVGNLRLSEISGETGLWSLIILLFSFRTHTVREILFDGYNDAMLSFVHSQLMYTLDGIFGVNFPHFSCFCSLKLNFWSPF